MSEKDEALHIDDAQYQYIARISHGKDSLKMLDVIITRGLPLDRITTTDVWATDTIRADFPEVVEFKERADAYIWRKYRIEVEHLCAMRDGEKLTYEKMFYHIPQRKADAGGWGIADSKEQSWASRRSGGRGVNPASKYQGKPQGFPLQRGAWCQKLKTRFLDSPSARGSTNIVEYLGIAADEPKRFGQLNEKKRAPLVEFGIEEGICGLHCKYENILGPSYDIGCRDGCWFCHNQGVAQLRLLRKKHPDLWALLLKWDTDSPGSFKPDGHTVHDFDRRFQMEDDGWLLPDDRTFRWAMLDDDVQMKFF